MPWRALLTDWQAGREHYYVLMEYRLPRLLLALFVGDAWWCADTGDCAQPSGITGYSRR
ncbi:hypothetical protein [Escherichia coli]|uniref:hypothetical protein n=1 Tax=Escherichia coli TaxID=562 RepID=UPI0038D39990